MVHTNLDFDMDQLLTLEHLTTAMAWTSIALSIISLFTNMFIPSRRKFPSRMTLYFNISVVAFCFSVCLGWFDNYSQVKYHDLKLGRDDPTTLCYFQGILIQLTSLCMLTWHWLINYVFFAVLYRGKSFLEVEEWEKNCHIIGWGLPILLTSVPAFSNKVGHEEGLFWCWIAETHNYWKFTCFYLPLFLSMMCTFYWVALIVKRLHQLRNNSDTERFLYNDYLRRHLFFVVMLFITWAVTLTWGINYWLHVDQRSTIPFWLAMAETIVVCGLGITVFIVFGFRTLNYRLLKQWWRRGKLFVDLQDIGDSIPLRSDDALSNDMMIDGQPATYSSTNFIPPEDAPC